MNQKTLLLLICYYSGVLMISNLFTTNVEQVKVNPPKSKLNCIYKSLNIIRLDLLKFKCLILYFRFAANVVKTFLYKKER